MSDHQDLATAYVLDALDSDERHSFVAHLATCEDCRAEVRELSGGLERLFDDVAESAPASLRERVLSAVQPAQVSPLAGRRGWVVATGIAAAIALTFGVAAIFLQNQFAESRAITAVLTAADAETVPLEGITGYVVRSGEAAVLVSHDLPELPPGRTYQLWLIDERGPHSAGLFQPDHQGAAVVLVADEDMAGKVVGLTAEPAGGSPQPTGTVLATADL
ncbi:anti-sigma factor [soil metagenome]